MALASTNSAMHETIMGARGRRRRRLREQAQRPEQVNLRWHGTANSPEITAEGSDRLGWGSSPN
jgi:hypothetical protein